MREFGCYQRTIDPAVRYRYLRDVREAFEHHGIGWAYWSYNETLTVMTPERQPFGPANLQNQTIRCSNRFLVRTHADKLVVVRWN